MRLPCSDQARKCVRARRVSGQDSDGRCLHELLSGHAARLALARYRRADKPTDQAKDTMKVDKSMGQTCAWRHLEHSHCQKHEAWALANSSRHGVGNDPTYNNTTCFETFPFPWPLGNEPQSDLRVESIAEAARDLVSKRNAW